MTNFYCLKWGSKYGPEYVNRLYGSILKNYKKQFNFFCIADDLSGIHPNISCINYNNFDPFIYPKDRLFTREKSIIMYRYTKGYNFILDLDILIHNDITNLVDQIKDKPKFIWTEWTPKDQLQNFGCGLKCFINSSLVGWYGDSAKFIFEHINQNQEKIFYTYDSFDRYVFYQHWRKNKIDLWDSGLFYNYNNSEPKYEYKKNAICCLYNTSHNKYLNRIEKELHEADDWSRKIWFYNGRF